MSRCISYHGEYSSHELTDNRCEWCRVWQCPACGEDLPYPLDGEDHDCPDFQCVVCGGRATYRTGMPEPKWCDEHGPHGRTSQDAGKP